ncbi:uncharacterized protein [Littorina saxatilis]|uniref:uncharacterized protein isoform X2 n=1 Tax=Littorina saxatilis TaxID=31220 RepID=UPI0038B492FD
MGIGFKQIERLPASGFSRHTGSVAELQVKNMVAFPLMATLVTLAIFAGSSNANSVLVSGTGVNVQAAANLLHLASTMLAQAQSTGIDFGTLHRDVEQVSAQTMLLLDSLPSTETNLAAELSEALSAAQSLMTISENDTAAMSTGFGRLVGALRTLLPHLEELVPAGTATTVVAGGAPVRRKRTTCVCLCDSSRCVCLCVQQPGTRAIA